jgi:hypothetical protein
MTGAVPVLADVTGPVTDAAPWWFTGIVGFVGTVVGGIITYITTTRANTQEAEAERERQRKAEVREISIRFIRLVSRPEMQEQKIQQLSENVGAVIEGFRQGKDPQQIFAELGEVSPLVMPLPGLTIDQSRAIQGAIKEVGRMAPHISESQALLAEMRLLVPNRIVQIAEIASNLAIGEQLKDQMGALRPENSEQRMPTLQEVLVVFTDEVRKEMGADPFESIDTKPEAIAEFLDGLSDEQH